MMRLDKYLSSARLFKSRTLAAEASSALMVFVDGMPARPSREIKVGSIIEIDTLSYYKKLEVLQVPRKNLPKSAAATLYELIEDRKKA